MLEKNFSGEHFWIKSHIGSVKLDCMFFPATSESVLTGKQLQSAKSKPEYLARPTILMCNPNALFY
jgi:hypothetical protein